MKVREYFSRAHRTHEQRIAFRLPTSTANLSLCILACPRLVANTILEINPASESKNEVQCAFLLDVVVAQSSTILQLFPGKNQPLLIGWDAFFVLDFRFDIIDGVGSLNIKGYGLHMSRALDCS